MDAPTCETCVHFIQHYRLEENNFIPINCGHCIYPRLKHRSPLTSACMRYIPCAELPPIITEMAEDEGFD